MNPSLKDSFIQWQQNLVPKVTEWMHNEHNQLSIKSWIRQGPSNNKLQIFHCVCASEDLGGEGFMRKLGKNTKFDGRRETSRIKDFPEI